jgi:hypothetical protein
MSLQIVSDTLAYRPEAQEGQDEATDDAPRELPGAKIIGNSARTPVSGAG